MFIIEGNIGAGKSTLLSMLGVHLPHLTICHEPVNQWHTEGQSLLEEFYKHPQRWAYTLETFALQCRVQEHLINQSYEFCVVERSIFSGHSVFAANSKQFMSSMEWQLYSSLFGMLTKSCKAPKGFIYLRSNPLVAYKRICKRQRSAESTMSLDYLVDIHQKHEALFCSSEVSFHTPIPVLIIDVDQEFEHNQEAFASHLKTIHEFMHTYVPSDNTSKRATI